jgi:fructose-1,6-bisphosphatase/inositol monophosphatase family enzyme
LEEAGGRMTDLYGERIRYNTLDVQNHNGVVSTNGAAHDEIINRLKPLLTEFGKVRVKTAKLRK